MGIKTTFIDPKEYSSPIVMAFDDPKYSSSKLQKLKLGTYHQKEELKQRGFTFDASSKKWIREKPFTEDLTAFGIQIDDPVFLISGIWNGDLPPATAEIRRKSSIINSTLQQIYHDPTENITYFQQVVCKEPFLTNMQNRHNELAQRMQNIQQGLLHQNATEHFRNDRKEELSNQLSVVDDALEYCRTHH